jgi:hypothetical protein
MGIKQQGGVFGRNPTFNNVEVENDLTVDGTLTHNGTQDITGQLNVDNLRLDGNTVSSTNTNGNIVLNPDGSGIVDVDANLETDSLTATGALEVRNLSNTTLNITNTDFSVDPNQVYGSLYFVSEDGSLEAGRKPVAGLQAVNIGGSGSYAALDFYRSNGTTAAATLKGMRLDWDGGAIFYQSNGTAEAARITTTGTFVPMAGGGIDFSATAGTGTSELLDDYEEGVFSPTVIGSVSAGTGTYTQNVGFYTKVGDRVMFTIAINMTGHTGSGNMRIAGLPFTSSGVTGDLSYFEAAASSLTYSGELKAYVSGGSTEAQFLSMASGASLAAVVLDPSCELRLTGVYRSA